MEPSIALTIGAAILIIGFMADEIHLRFGVPDILALIFLGALFGPVLGIIPRDPLMSLAPYFAALTLAIVLFESGINFPITKSFSETPRAILYAFLGVVLSTLFLTPAASLIFSWSPLEAALLGVIVGGTSSAIVLPLVQRMKVSGSAKDILRLESILTDGIIVVIAMLILRLLTIPTLSITVEIVSREIIGSIMLSLIIGFAAALLLSRIIASAQKKLYGDIMILGLVVLIYAVSEQIGGNGALTTFIFALTLRNVKQLMPWLRSMGSPTDKDLKQVVESAEERMPSFKFYSRKFYAQISFLMRTYFFAFLGMIFCIPSPDIFLIGISLTMMLLAARYLSTYLIGIKSTLSKRDKFLMSLICGRGLAAAVLASLIISYGLETLAVIQELTTQIIIYTSIISALAAYLSEKKKLLR